MGPRLQVAQQLTTVEVAPLTFLGVVVDGQFELTLMAREPRPSGMNDPLIDSSSLGGELNSIHPTVGLDLTDGDRDQCRVRLHHGVFG